MQRDILFTAVRELPKLRDEDKFEPWLWGVANNVTKVFRRVIIKYAQRIEAIKMPSPNCYCDVLIQFKKP